MNKVAPMILKVLEEHSDEKNKLSQKKIKEKLLEKDLVVDRKTVRRNLDMLQELGFIEAKEVPRNEKAGELLENTILTDICLKRDFTQAELRLMIDSLLFSKHIPAKERKELAKKLEKLSSQNFKSRVRYIQTLPGDLSPETTDQVFKTIDVLDEAICKGRQVSFHYCEYRVDKKLHPRLNHNGEPRVYTINPYHMVAANGRYFLICNNEPFASLSNFRVDLISDIRILEDSPVKPLRYVTGQKDNLNAYEYVSQHIHMFSGAQEIVTFRVRKNMLTAVFDWFSSDVAFFDETEDQVTVRVTTSFEDMRCWALQYARYVTLLFPEALVNQVKEDLEMAAENYGLKVENSKTAAESGSPDKTE